MRVGMVWVLWVFFSGASACGAGGEAPVMQSLADQVGYVNQELVVVLQASDIDSTNLRFSVNSEIKDLGERSTISLLPVGAGQFRWTPQPEDVGTWVFDFVVSDGQNEDSISVQIEVKAGGALESTPKFLRPTGDGTWLDLATAPCVDIEIEILDSDSLDVTIGEEAPRIEGATLTKNTGLSASWQWCPTKPQIEAESRYPVVFSADDGENSKATASYLIVLKRPISSDCPGDAPSVSHTPADLRSLSSVSVSAVVTDDQGLKDAPLVYYSAAMPGRAPDLSVMTQATMVLTSGDTSSGTWNALIPNPVAASAAGASQLLYYVIVASDDDDPVGDCDHLSQFPEQGSYIMEVTHPGGSGDAALCEACTSDNQCGVDGDLCLALGGQASSGFCGRSCTSNASCGDGYSCGLAEITSVDGAVGRQCIPLGGVCRTSGSAGACVDDAFEENDSLSVAAAGPSLAEGVYDMVSCPAGDGLSDDPDWFKVSIASETTVTFEVDGGSASDLDLVLTDGLGFPIEVSTSSNSSEQISECLAPGDYYFAVVALGVARNEYVMSLDFQGDSCNAISVCTADSAEDDDSLASARSNLTLPYQASAQSICALDDDWYEIYLFNGETLTVDLAFLQNASSQDLDLHLYDSGNVNLTPCSESEPSLCTAAQGQSATSNEHLEVLVLDSDYYYIVVRGYGGSENDYSISIDVR